MSSAGEVKAFNTWKSGCCYLTYAIYGLGIGHKDEKTWRHPGTVYGPLGSWANEQIISIGCGSRKHLDGTRGALLSPAWNLTLLEFLRFVL